MDLLDGDVELTEFEAMDVESIKGVGQGANGFPILVMKGLAGPVVKGARDCPKCEKSYDADHEGGKCENCGTDLPDAPAAKAEFDRDAAKAAVRELIAKAADRKGNVDEAPDIAGGTQVIAMIADLIIAEAGELKAGNAGEIADIQQLACAAEMIWCWRTGEEAVSSGSVMPATALMQAAAKAIEEAPEDMVALRARIVDGLAKAKHSAAGRRKLAEAGNALSDGSYPIADEHDLKSAAILAQSGHGDVEGAKRLIGRRAKELGVKNPLDDNGKDDTAKSQIAPGGTDVDTVTKGSDDLQKAVADAVAKAVAPLKEQVDLFSGELAKVKAQPLPGGPVLSRNVQVKAPDGVAREDWAAKAAYYREMAETVTDRPTADGYRKLAREADAKALPAAT
jgi:hypothetical protein